MKKLYKKKLCQLLALLLIVVGISNSARAQTTVTGRVTSPDGVDPIPGVNVVVKGSTIGTITDVEGKFSISVPADGVLVFSYIGHVTEEIPVGDRTVVDISLTPDIQTLNEVVVVGYGTQEKVNVTGAVSAVKIDEKITGRALTNVSSGLTGLVPGLTATQSSGMAGNNNASLLIRGLGSVNNSGPLIVVDGMPDVDINRLNFNDIESISVLKDAASASVYGSRGANGVVLITTKSGKGMQKTQINYTGSYAIEEPVKSYDFLANYPRTLTLHQRAAAVNTLPSNFIFKNGTIDQWMAMGMVDPLRFPNTDWWDIIVRDGKIMNHNLSASGGNDKSNFFISVGYLDQDGIQINNDFSRYNTRFNYDYKLRENMNVGIRFNGNWSKFTYSLEDGFTDDDPTNTAGFDMQYAIPGITPYNPVSGYYGGVMSYGEDVQAYNPYSVYMNNINEQNRQEINPNIFIDWSPIKGLTARLDYALNYYNQFRYLAPMPNRAYNFQANAFGSRVYVGDNAGIANYTNTGYKTQLQGRISYNTKLAENHNLSALVVYSEEYWYNRYQLTSRNDRLHPSLHEIDAALPQVQVTEGNSNEEGLRSYIGRINYSAFDKYLLEASFRYDGSSKFLKGHQYGFFPSVAVGWRFSEENFMASEGWLSNGKLRASFGGLGNNSGVQRYEQQDVLSGGHYMNGSYVTKGLVYRKMINEDLTWEETQVLNVGLELGFLNNRLTTEFDFYDRKTKGMLLPSQMSVFLGGAYDAPRANIGDMRNRGIEGNFTWRDQIGEISYSVNLNASYNANTIENWSEFVGRGTTYSGNNIFVGMPYNYVYSYVASGIAQTWQDVYNATPQGASPGDILREDLNGDGRIDGNDRKAYKNVQRDRPTTNFGLTGNVAWRGFDLTFLLQGATGRKDHWLNNYNNVSFPTQRYASTWDHWNNPWNWDNRNGEWPRLSGNANREESTFWLDDMSYLRVKNIQLGYRIPSNVLSRIRVANARIYASAENIATITGYRGLDPEKIGNRSDAYPLTKSYAIGINIGI
ncbi:SusC/RagA family TonB-linked outer membrane protein [Chryseosolibacter indicus]|uniref:TonB-dependent receptor n=1 Tax=Chryseosolibacter indicus TaxID=2782351 RepID=A0ABS5VRW9_9BACT|nr:TonB-dependent receptor [Chryseosolibacter indicus]MBT1703778.1 TonB-dependent receptor [Chryseosolibacter indicus]